MPIPWADCRRGKPASASWRLLRRMNCCLHRQPATAGRDRHFLISPLQLILWSCHFPCWLAIRWNTMPGQIKLYRTIGSGSWFLNGFLQNVTNRIRGFHDVHEAVLSHHAQIGETDRDTETRIQRIDRSEERRVGKECRSRWSPYQ